MIELHKCINSVSHYARLAHQAVGMQMLSIREVRKSMMNMTWTHSHTHRAITKIPSIVDLDQTSFARILSYLGLEVNILCWLRKLSILNWTGDPENFDQLNPVMAFAGTGFGVYWIRFFFQRCGFTFHRVRGSGSRGIYHFLDFFFVGNYIFKSLNPK